MATNSKNFGKMRKALVIAHNSGNTKAINKDMIDGAEVSNEVFVTWKSDTNALRTVVCDYVQKRKDARFDSTISEGDVYAARERIYPAWKKLLGCADNETGKKELHVCEADVEDLVGFAWKFMNTGAGTGECMVDSNTFRKKVESMIGCMIAEKSMLSDEERDILDKFIKANSRVAKALEKIGEIEEKIAEWTGRKADFPNEVGFQTLVDNEIKKLENTLKDTKEAKTKAEIEVKEVATKAKEIQMRMKYAGK